jgi:hypothetical protein
VNGQLEAAVAVSPDKASRSLFDLKAVWVTDQRNTLGFCASDQLLLDHYFKTLHPNYCREFEQFDPYFLKSL